MFLSDVKNLSRHSHAIVKVRCQSQISDNCYDIVDRSYRDVMNTVERNNGVYLCLHCSKYKKSMGADNPNSQYNYDRNMFEDIDTVEKAYFLGWIASDGCLSKNTVCLSIHRKDVACLELLRDIVTDSIPIKYPRENMVSFAISSKIMMLDLCRHLGIEPGKKSHKVRFPKLDHELAWVFLRGYFDGDGTIRKLSSKSSPDCGIASESTEMLTAIQEFCGIPCRITKGYISYSGTNAIDFLGKLYANCGEYKLIRKFETYQGWLTWRLRLPGKNTAHKIMPYCLVYKTDPLAVLPSKANASDVGCDLTIIKQEKILVPNSETIGATVLYDTGIKLSLTYGYYAEIVPRSSLSKSGYMLANGIGILDASYSGNVFVALTKTNLNSPDLVLPFKCCQLIFREQIHVQVIETCDYQNETAREDGGFGSTDINSL